MSCSDLSGRREEKGGRADFRAGNIQSYRDAYSSAPLCDSEIGNWRLWRLAPACGNVQLSPGGSYGDPCELGAKAVGLLWAKPWSGCAFPWH